MFITVFKGFISPIPQVAAARAVEEECGLTAQGPDFGVKNPFVFDGKIIFWTIEDREFPHKMCRLIGF